jgi:UDP-N-acetyl-D-mannosaminuronic acid dehydrogenase
MASGDRMNKTIVVLGIGYVGLPLAITLARVGYKVKGVDVNKQVVKSIREGSLTIQENNIETLFNEEKVKKNFKVDEKPCQADIFIVCVQTPLDRTSKMPDLSYIVSAIESINPYLKKGNLVIVESTLPPLTCRKLIKPLIEKGTKLEVGKEVFLAHCPERVMPGQTFHELIYNNRIIGGINPESARLAREVYSSFVKGDIELTDDATAEMVKLMENTHRDVNIALANELALVAETLGVNVKEAIRLANKHPRVKILSPGIGVGGHCLPKDPWFLIHSDPKNTNLILTARKVNESMPEKTASKVRKFLKGIKDPKIIALGITYKPDSDDLRESPAAEVIKNLKEEGYNISAYDNFVKGHEYDSIANIAKGADCIVVLVEHTSIKKELEKTENEIKTSMKTPLILRIGTSYEPDPFDRGQR